MPCKTMEDLIDVKLIFEDSSSDSKSIEIDLSNNDSSSMDALGDVDSESDIVDDDIEDMSYLFEALLAPRYLKREGHWMKSKDFVPFVGRQVILSFETLVQMISEYEMFQNNEKCKQTSMVWQVVTLDRLGHYGNGACLDLFIFLWGISHGSVVLYTNRVLLVDCK
ncbi:hypothetical protein R1flu_009860 [Riccia fluitans]|uniref:Uncharacterized protein n=1 Tax=Riccia fluitans TaxID=41844 RepID=A0ABD1Z464_9MARC